MPPRLAVLSLPNDVLIKLHQRLVESNFSDYHEHSDWLREQGHLISKSSLHRYSIDNEHKIRSSTFAISSFDGLDNQRIDIRMRCLELASRSVPDDNFESLTSKAEELFCWVCAD